MNTNKNTFAKILVALIALAAVIAGAIAIYKKFFCKSDDLCDFADDFDDEENVEPATEVKRGYVSIPLDGSEENTSDDKTEAKETDEEEL